MTVTSVRGGIDRSAHRRTDAEWLAGAWPRARVLVVDEGSVLVDEGGVLVGEDGTHLVLVEPAQAPEGERYFVGVDVHDTPYFAVAGSLAPRAGTAPSVGSGGTGLKLATLRDVGHLLGTHEADLFLTAVALVNWHRRHAYSPKTGRPTTVAEGGWTRVTDDGETVWPRTDPAVIMLVNDGVAGPDGRCLLGHNAAWNAPEWQRRYSCLAGFVEPGESAEGAVAREVAEEVGVDVWNIRYFASQPWPFPGSLMLGFTARADPDQPIRLDDGEIADARWFTRADVAAVLAGERGDFALPFSVSIAHHLVRTWASVGS